MKTVRRNPDGVIDGGTPATCAACRHRRQGLIQNAWRGQVFLVCGQCRGGSKPSQIRLRAMIARLDQAAAEVAANDSHVLTARTEGR